MSMKYDFDLAVVSWHAMKKLDLLDIWACFVLFSVYTSYLLPSLIGVIDVVVTSFFCGFFWGGGGICTLQNHRTEDFKLSFFCMLHLTNLTTSARLGAWTCLIVSDVCNLNIYLVLCNITT